MEMIAQIITNVLTAFYQPFGFSVVLSVMAMFFYLFAYEPTGAGKGWKEAARAWADAFRTSVFFRKLFLLIFTTTMILFRTLWNRNMWMNPLSNVMGGWGIWAVAKDGTKSLTTESFENVIMMVPFTALMLWTFGEKLVKRTDFRTVAGRATVIAFGFSLGIELTQLLLRIGTFQLSDLFYNTLGGFLGGAIYWLCRQRKAARHSAAQKLLERPKVEPERAEQGA